MQTKQCMGAGRSSLDSGQDSTTINRGVCKGSRWISTVFSHSVQCDSGVSKCSTHSSRVRKVDCEKAVQLNVKPPSALYYSVSENFLEMEDLGERFSELMGERETRDALKFLLDLDTKDLLAYTLILKNVHRSTFLYLLIAN